MSSLAKRLVCIIKDNRGKIAKFTICLAAAVVDPGGAAVDAIRTALALVTKGMNTSASISDQAPKVDTVTEDASYGDNQDKMLLTFRTLAGTLATFKVPAPLETCFDATDKETVNLGNASVEALVDFITAECVNKAGVGYVTCLGGRRARRRAKNK